MTNPIAGSHRRLVVEGGVIVAAALVGDLSRVGLITQLYDRGTVLGPDEPGQLLLGEAGLRAGRAARRGRGLRLCGRHGRCDPGVRRRSPPCRESTRATTGCGGCEPVVRRLLAESTQASPSRRIRRLSRCKVLPSRPPLQGLAGSSTRTMVPTPDRGLDVHAHLVQVDD